MLQTWLSNTEVEGNWLMKTTKPLKKARVTMAPARKIDKRTTLNPTRSLPKRKFRRYGFIAASIHTFQKQRGNYFGRMRPGSYLIAVRIPKVLLNSFTLI